MKSDEVLMLTRSGVLVDPRNVDPSKVSVEDIAWALHNTFRWGGHADPPVSVLQHSVAMARCAWYRHYDQPGMALACLWHDAGEAFWGDIPRRIKHSPQMAWFREQEHKCCITLIEHHAPEALPWLDAIKVLDNESLARERTDRFPAARDFGYGRAMSPRYYSKGDDPVTWVWWHKRLIKELR